MTDLDKYKPAKGEKHHVSAFVKAYTARERPTTTVEMDSVLGHGVVGPEGETLTRVCYRINTKAEDNDALVAAHATVHRLSQRAEGGAQDFKSDADALNEAKNVQAMLRACRDPDDPSSPLFLAAEWMEKHFDTDILGGLMNGYNEVRARKNGLPWEVHDTDVDTIRDTCVGAFDSELPEMVLALYTREYISHVLILTAKRWHDERELAVEALEAAVAGSDGWEDTAAGVVSILKGDVQTQG